MKARLNNGQKRYKGDLLVNSFFTWRDGSTDDFYWVFIPDAPGTNLVKSNIILKTREAAIEDARAHGITIEE